MSIEKSIIYMNDEQQVVTINIEGREEQINVYRDGRISISTETSGRNFNLFEDRNNQQNAMAQSLGSYNPQPYQPSKADNIQQYLLMLYESQKCGHIVNDEIEAALKQFKNELGI